jgi:RecB family exonuclease
VKGRLDRYDANKDRLRVIDYKTGGSPWVRAQDVIENRTHLQLPIYCHLLRTSQPNETIDNMGIYSTREARVRWLADEHCSVEELVRAALDCAVEVVSAIRAGHFPPTPADEKSCDGCAQHFLCGRPEQDSNPT